MAHVVADRSHQFVYVAKEYESEAQTLSPFHIFTGLGFTRDFYSGLDDCDGL